MSRGNPTARSINTFSSDPEVTLDAGESRHAQPIRPDDYDNSHDFDRKRERHQRRALDQDPLIIY